MIEGIDLSRWNATPDLAGLGFMFARVSHGVTADSSAEGHLMRGRAAGLVLGAYAYLETGPHAAEPEAQAALFVTRCAVLSGPLMLALDVEPLDPLKPDPPARVADFAHRFWRTVRTIAGQPCGTYGGNYVGTLDLPLEMAADPLWRAKWTPPYTTVRPWATWTILQYAVTGSPKVDRDRYPGTADELRAAFGLPVAVLPCPA